MEHDNEPSFSELEALIKENMELATQDGNSGYVVKEVANQVYGYQADKVFNEAFGKPVYELARDPELGEEILIINDNNNMILEVEEPELNVEEIYI